ncbi:MAG: ATP-binding protein [Armatimonadota bacterium]|nr:MAG: ATP-binding protein [Armatimonadota bacterium]
MIITVASGKGGTGKTTIATSLALLVPRAQFVDADAEEPNAHLFFHPTIEQTIPVEMMAPEVDLESCIFCGKCAEFCQFNALAVIKDKVLVFPELCHGCGGCVLVCPERAMREKQRKIGEVEIGTAKGMRFIQGRLKPAEPSAVRIIREEMAHVSDGLPTIVDAAPGTACGVVETISQADFCLLVTEPTPFGLHDLMMAVDVAAELGVPAGVVINRSGARDRLIDEACEKRGVAVLLTVPFQRTIAEAYSRGKCLVEAFPEWRKALQKLFDHIQQGVAR